jgi:hypothetical protein
MGVLGVCGCESRPVVGGTGGHLRSNGQPLSEVQLTVHRREGASWSAIGFAVTGAGGEFELVTNRAAGPLQLEPGEYRFTLESVGAPVQIPREYLQAETTPLAVMWPTSDGHLQLELGALPAIR